MNREARYRKGGLYWNDNGLKLDELEAKALGIPANRYSAWQAGEWNGKDSVRLEFPWFLNFCAIAVYGFFLWVFWRITRGLWRLLFAHVGLLWWRR